MKKIKQVFPSRNYITVDSYGDVEVIFNPVGDGFEGDDKLMFRKGRWAFRVNDFLSGKVMADGSKEGMGRKVYSLNLVYDDADGEPIVNTTYVDPTSVIPLDGSVVDVVGSEKLAQEKTLQSIENLVQGLNSTIPYFELTANETQKGFAKVSTAENQVSIDMSVTSIRSEVANLPNKEDFSNLVSPVLAIGSAVDRIEGINKSAFVTSENGEWLADVLDSFYVAWGARHYAHSVHLNNIAGNMRYSVGTVFYFGTTHFIALRSDCITISVGSELLLLGDMSEYNNGVVKRLDGVKFASSDVTKIVS